MAKKKKPVEKTVKDLIRVYPKKDKVGWTIYVPGYGRFQPATETSYMELPAEAIGVCRKHDDLIIKEEKNG